MRRREVLAVIAAASMEPIATRAQQVGGKIRSIGYLGSGSFSGSVQFIDAFRQGLGELGWFEGQNVQIHFRFAEGRFARLPDLAAELVALAVDVIVAAPTPAAVAAKNATKAIPVVMTNVGDPVGLGVIASLPNPGGNVTGLAYSVGVEVFGKQLEVLKEAIPYVRRAGVLLNPDNPAHAAASSNVKLAASSLGLELRLLATRSADELEGAFSDMAKERVQALLVLADTIFVQDRAGLAELAIKYRMPTMHGIRENVEAGGMIYYGHNSREQFRKAAAFVDKIFRGIKPADLPVEQPTKFELVVNLKTANALGLTIPPTLLARADEVIE